MINQNLLLADDGYNIQRSLRLRSSASAYLSRTVASTPTSWTASFWVKRGQLGTLQQIFASRLSGTGAAYLGFDGSDRLGVANNLTGVTTNAVYRDPSAWYHFVVSWNSSNVVTIYCNGVTQSVTGSISGASQLFTSSWTNTIGRYGDSATGYLDGYLTDINFIDGQALTPSSFGETDPITGVWKPKKYGGTYGTNGFYLNFSDNSSTTTLGYDKSGNSNNWTCNNISLTAGSTYDSTTDVPTLTSESAGNYAVLNPLDYGANGIKSVITDGNLKGFDAGSASFNSTSVSSIGVMSGKFYCEFTSITAFVQAGILYGLPTSDIIAAGIRYYGNNGIISKDGVSQGTFSTYTTNDVIGLALDADAKTIAFYKNNTLITTITYTSTNPVYFGALLPNQNNGVIHANFGQRPFAYTPPSGFKALNTFNLPDATIKAGNKHFDITTFAGVTGGTQTITNSGGFQPDFAWNKTRATVDSHYLVDSVRGVANYLSSNATAAEASAAQFITSFNSNGISYSTSGYNAGQTSNIVWQWKAGGSAVSNTAGSITSQVSANPSAGFSVVTYTGNGSAGATVGHGLGVAPALIILKSRTTAYDWFIQHQSLGATKVIYLNLTDAAGTNSSYWNNTAPTSSVFTVGVNNGVNQSSQNFVAYCFSEVAGYSKFGGYDGNNSVDGPFIYCGFRPKFILIKKSAGGSNADWHLHDTARDTYNSSNSILLPDSSGAEAVNAAFAIDVLSNGFKLRTSDASTNGPSYSHIYMAFAESPFRYSLAR